MNVFDNYAKYYDLLYHDKDYKIEAQYISDLIKHYGSHTKTIFEMGCGTGKHAKLLSEKGYDIFGIDLSQTMLDEAKKLKVNCEIGDVRTFRTERKFDTVISLFHILSYQTTDDDAASFFETAKEHLNKNGIIIFDIWYKDAVLAQLPEKRIKELENDEIKVKRFCIPEHIEDQSLVLVNYNIEIIDKKTSRVEVIKETHPMRYFSEDEIKCFAKKYDIEIVHSEEWLTKKKPSDKTWGVCFIGVVK